MVRLSFIEVAPAPIDTVWAYFSKFENIPDWDSNTKKIIPQTQARESVGAPYKLTTLWKGEESQLQYAITEIKRFKKIAARGENKTTVVVDEIFFEQKGQSTQITYVADISLKHILKIFTPFIRGDLDRLAADAQQGMQAKIKQLYK